MKNPGFTAVAALTLALGIEKNRHRFSTLPRCKTTGAKIMLMSVVSLAHAGAIAVPVIAVILHPERAAQSTLRLLQFINFTMKISTTR